MLQQVDELGKAPLRDLILGGKQPPGLHPRYLRNKNMSARASRKLGMASPMKPRAVNR